MGENKNQGLLNESTSYKSTLDLNNKIDYEDSLSTQQGYLKVIGSNGEENELIELGKCDYLIGRISECDIQFKVENVSRKHALISFRDNEYWLEDLDSKNGTYINGVKIAKCLLHNDDQIDVGGVRMYFREVTVLKDK